MDPTQVCGRTLEDFLGEIERFHGWTAPGVVIGGFMVDRAKALLGQGVEADALVETVHCLPDAVQLFTPCTCGNGWLKVLDWDKFALSLYDKKTLNGFRVWLDLEKLANFPSLFQWYMRLVDKKSLPLEVLVRDITLAGWEILSSAPVRITRFYEKHKKGEIAVCPECGEAYPTRQGPRCLFCQGQGYYETQEAITSSYLMQALRH
jgi:formylmethanofuran dehydrogenase subunit E